MAEGTESVGRLKNISRAGIFVSTQELPRPGAPVALQFDTPLGRPVNLRGEVRWISQGIDASGVPTGFGVLLNEPPGEYREFFLWAAEQAEKDDD